ncbi:MAG: hypothetical protein LBR95_09800 [Azoarcus sp.]|jgi:hypothetical protein|nr:hypothetical protein [Azoarcus sp.]
MFDVAKKCRNCQKQKQEQEQLEQAPQEESKSLWQQFKDWNRFPEKLPIGPDGSPKPPSTPPVVPPVPGSSELLIPYRKVAAITKPVRFMGYEDSLFRVDKSLDDAEEANKWVSRFD